MKPVVSSLVALALAIAPMSAFAAKPVHHSKVAHVVKDAKKAEKSDKADEKASLDKGEKAEKSEKGSAIVRVKAGKKDGAPAAKALHHASNVNLEGAGHHEPKGHKEDGALVAASMITKTPAKHEHEKIAHESKKAIKDLPKLPDPKAGKPGKGGAEKGARKGSEKKNAEASASDDGETSRDEVNAELVARGHGQKSADSEDKGVISNVSHEERASSKTTHDAAKEDPSADDAKAPATAKDAKGHKNAHGSAKTCAKDPVEIVRGPEVERFALTKCDGTIAPLAIEHLSVLVRPGGAARPTASYAELAKKTGQELAPHVRRVDPGLVERIQALVEHFGKPGSPAKLAIVSGYRPASVGSMHSSGRAMDFRLEGVKNEDVVEFCKTLDDTGCGFYPNSSFVHVDVRDPGKGHVTWIDASGPGETPRYVSSWPEPGAAKKGLEHTSLLTVDPLAAEGAELLKAKRPADLDPPVDADSAK